MTLALAVLVASLLGSVHCAAMCGAFVCFYAAPGHVATARLRASAWSHAAYNGGRLVSYASLGALAGSLGGAMDQVGLLTGVGHVAAIVSGLLMIAWGANAALVASGARVLQPPVPAFAQRAMTAAMRRVREQPPAVRAATTGLVTTLLPCGWLYAFVATAAGSGSAGQGALLMTVFWAGTLPMMLTIGAGAQRLLGRHRARLPLATAIAVCVLGVLSIVGHVALASPAHAAHGPVAAMTELVR